MLLRTHTKQPIQHGSMGIGTSVCLPVQVLDQGVPHCPDWVIQRGKKKISKGGSTSIFLHPSVPVQAHVNRLYRLEGGNECSGVGARRNDDWDWRHLPIIVGNMRDGDGTGFKSSRASLNVSMIEWRLTVF